MYFLSYSVVKVWSGSGQNSVTTVQIQIIFNPGCSFGTTHFEDLYLVTKILFEVMLVEARKGINTFNNYYQINNLGEINQQFPRKTIKLQSILRD